MNHSAFMMIDKIKEHIAKIEDFTAKTKDELEQFRIQYLGKKGVLNDFFAAFKEVPNEEKKTFGQVVNELKQKAEAKVQEWRDRLEERNESKGVYGDLSRPATPAPIGARHPISLVKNEIVKIFPNIGFEWKMIGITSLLSISPNTTLHAICRTLSLYKLIPISSCALTPALCRYVIWKITSHLSAQSPQGVCSATRLSLLALTACFTK